MGNREVRNEYTAMCVSCPGIEKERNKVMEMTIGSSALHVFVSVGLVLLDMALTNPACL
jgi:hypothetical protein